MLCGKFSLYVCAHKKIKFKSQILENELNAIYETTAISGKIALYFDILSLLAAS